MFDINFKYFNLKCFFNKLTIESPSFFKWIIELSIILFASINPFPTNNILTLKICKFQSHESCRLFSENYWIAIKVYGVKCSHTQLFLSNRLIYQNWPHFEALMSGSSLFGVEVAHTANSLELVTLNFSPWKWKLFQQFRPE